MENKELDEKFKSTELEDLQKQFEKDKFEIKKEFEKVGEFQKDVSGLHEELSEIKKEYIEEKQTERKKLYKEVKIEMENEFSKKINKIFDSLKKQIPNLKILER